MYDISHLEYLCEGNRNHFLKKNKRNKILRKGRHSSSIKALFFTLLKLYGSVCRIFWTVGIINWFALIYLPLVVSQHRRAAAVLCWHLTALLICIIVHCSRRRPIPVPDTGCWATLPPITGAFRRALPEDETSKKQPLRNIPAGRDISAFTVSRSRGVYICFIWPGSWRVI